MGVRVFLETQAGALVARDEHAVVTAGNGEGQGGRRVVESELGPLQIGLCQQDVRFCERGRGVHQAVFSLHRGGGPGGVEIVRCGQVLEEVALELDLGGLAVGRDVRGFQGVCLGGRSIGAVHQDLVARFPFPFQGRRGERIVAGLGLAVVHGLVLVLVFVLVLLLPLVGSRLVAGKGARQEHQRRREGEDGKKGFVHVLMGYKASV